MKKFCPKCQQLNLKSCVYVGTSTTTLAMWNPGHYNETGEWIINQKNPNKVWTDYDCSNGHHWREIE